MSEPTHTVPPQQAGSGEVYCPLCGLAIAGFALAILFVGLLVLSIVVALIQGAPLFLGYWFLLVPLAAGLLSYLGQRQILAAEGTRAGLRLARWGLGLSVFAGSGYFAYVFMTEEALRRQANTFLMIEDDNAGFFPRVLAGQLNHAFLLTRPPYHRSGNPNDDKQMAELYDRPGGGFEVGPGDLSKFHDHWLIRAMVMGGKENTNIEPLGVQHCFYEKKGYQVQRSYRITAPEVVAEVSLPVQSTEAAEAGQQRQWHLAFPHMRIVKTTPTDLGLAMKNLRLLGQGFLESWLQELNRGKACVEFAGLDKTNWERLVPKAAFRQRMREEAQRAFLAAAPERLNYAWPQENDLPDIVLWRQVQGKLLINPEFTLRFSAASDFPAFTVDCQVTLQSQKTLDPLKLTEAPTWEIKELQMIRATVQADPKKK